ncbi:MAG: hypothetical protein IOC84_04465 [Rhodobacter sp.]|jgi:hypothetical protein|nr:hypothetical protein [Rhodobacter sp.]
MKPAPIEVARTAWAGSLPDWVEALALECGRTSQNKVAERLGRSAAMVSQILRNKYPGDLTGFEERFRGVFQAQALECPALGLIPSHECQDWRVKSRVFAVGNPLRRRMFLVCPACPRNRSEQ